MYSLKEPLYIGINKILFKNNSRGQEEVEGNITKVYKEPFRSDMFTFLTVAKVHRSMHRSKLTKLYT